MAEQQKKAEVIDVATQTAQLIQLPDGRQVSDRELLVEIYNIILESKK